MGVGSALGSGQVAVVPITAQEQHVACWRFDHQGQPRTAVGFSFGLLLGLLHRLGLVPDPEADVAEAVEAMRRAPVAADSRVIGSVEPSPAGLVTLSSAVGTTRVIDMLSGEQLPRIC